MEPKRRRLDREEVGIEGDFSQKLTYANSGGSLRVTMFQSKFFSNGYRNKILKILREFTFVYSLFSRGQIRLTTSTNQPKTPWISQQFKILTKCKAYPWGRLPTRCIA
jgi:hypothetical protein